MKKIQLNSRSASITSLRRAYLATLLAACGSLTLSAQQLSSAPRLVVNITIDQLRTDYLEYFAPLYSQDGFRRLLNDGRVYDRVNYPFTPIDRASAITCVATGASPHYNKIISQQWLERDGKKTSYCVADKKYVASPANIACSTISDELKVSTDGRAIVFGVAYSQDAAILSAGHAADGAFWVNDANGLWATSSYYPSAAQSWVRAYNSNHTTRGARMNDAVADAAISCIDYNAMGRDDITDYLSVTLSATLGSTMGSRSEMEGVYTSLDNTLANIIRSAEQRVGKDRVLFVVTSTGYTDTPPTDLTKYKIPTGTFYINRTSQLLNMYLSAIYGSGTWVEAYYKNQIYLNHRLIDNQKINYSELLQRSKDLLRTTAGVTAVIDTPYDTAITGDLWVEVAPGWKILNEDTNETYQSSMAFIPFPVIFYGAGIKAEYISEEITTEYIAPTVAKTLRIRAPNACQAPPLF